MEAGPLLPKETPRPRRVAVLAGAALALCAVAGVVASADKGCHHGQPCAASSSSGESDAGTSLAAFPAGDSAGPRAVPAATASAARVALGGVDVVAYQTVLRAGNASVAGKKEFRYTLTSLDGIDPTNAFASEFHFASAEHRDLFAANPAKYVPQYGGFCAFGITNEMNANSTKGMDVASVTEGWPWARDYLGPPGNPDSWVVHDGKLYLTFFSGPLAMFEADIDANVLRGDTRWASWFGEAATEDAVMGPFNSDCLASSYGPPVSRTCCMEPQKLSGIATPQKLTDTCIDKLEEVCGGRQGDNPVSSSGSKCSLCLEANFTLLEGHCGATTTAVHTVVDKVFCW